MILHPNAAIRLMIQELARLNDGRPELILALEDPRIPAGVAAQQLIQIECEIAELVQAIHTVEADLEARHASTKVAA